MATTTTLLLSPPTVHEDKLKRKMKTPLQLETLERVFAEEKYPSEAIRASLSAQLGLSNRQLKMWFCHRRLKERKTKDHEEGGGEEGDRGEDEEEKLRIQNWNQCQIISPQHYVQYNIISPIPHDQNMECSTLPSSIKKEDQASSSSHESQDHGSAWQIKRKHESSDGSTRKKSKQLLTYDLSMMNSPSINNGIDPQRLAELQAIASVENQLGEPLRWDSPCLGIHFDPLPHGAFTSTASELRKTSSSQDSRALLDIRESVKPAQKDPFDAEIAPNLKATVSYDGQQCIVGHHPGSKLLHEYQFIPERPTGRDGMMTPPPLGLPSVCTGPEISIHGVMLQQGSILPVNDCLGNALGLDGRPLARLMMMQGDIFEHQAIVSQPFVLHHDAYSGAFGYEPQFGVYNNLNMYNNAVPHPASLCGIENIPIYNDEQLIHGNKGSKSEEIRGDKKMDAQRKRIQKEIEREELARRKREEHLQKEREKETERMMREKQREDERIQKELRREMEQHYRHLQREAQKLEREREKEEARRLKESTRLKASIERATARRLARECVELIDDERLELLEAATAAQGLPSIYLLDGETLQNLDRYKAALKKFPPPSVEMKSPLVISPWIDSQQNLGNLLMVWKFLIAFADVLGLSPFALDEFVQAFHDYDSRLLAEIHVSLIRTITKDIEEVAKASACGGAVNQYTAPSSIGGGHSQLIAAASAWGFNFREWNRHLNLLTWPEILRQFSLAAGYGPIWKHQQTDVMSTPCIEEGHHVHEKGHGYEQNTKPVNRVRGSSHSRISGHKLTPGTVKYAAFHVVSAQGPNGLTISEIADRIEKYGLRDLSTSKTPESSVAAALSRDTVFFERVAPSTYCVKRQFQRNPEDAERLIQAALEKTRLFQSGMLADACDVESGMEDIDEVRREPVSDDESDCMEIDDKDQGKASYTIKAGKIADGKEQLRDDSRKSSLMNESFGSPEVYYNGRCKNAAVSSLISTDELVYAREIDHGLERAADSTVDVDIDENHVGEPWVQGLMEAEYSDLSVEERLNALVALVEAVNEGNTIRMALEDRIEAATALKRQMWAEVQQDKRRSKEEQESKALPQSDELATADGAQIVSRDHNLDKESQQENLSMGSSGATSEKTRAQLKVDIDFRADELFVLRSQPLGLDRRHNRYWQFVTSSIADDPGCGRLYFESAEDGHWEVIDTDDAFSALMENLDTRGVREAHLHGVLQKLERLIREGMKKYSAHDQRLAAKESQGPSSNNGFGANAGYASEDGSSGIDTVFHEGGSIKPKWAIQIHVQTERHQVIKRYEEFDKWLWSRQTPELSDLEAMKMEKKKTSELLCICGICHDLYWPGEKQCLCCHTVAESSAGIDAHFSHDDDGCEKERTDTVASARTQEGPSTKLLPSRLQLLKLQILSIEAALPMEATNKSWTESRRRAWGASLKHASSPGELLQILNELERVVRRDWLSSPYDTIEEVSGRSLPAADADADADVACSHPLLPRVPRTTSAVALRLMKLDSALCYEPHLKKPHSVPPNTTTTTTPVPVLIPTKEAANTNSQKLFPAKEENNSISPNAHLEEETKRVSAEGTLPRRPLLVKLSRGRPNTIQNIGSNCHREQESNCTFPCHERQGGQSKCEEDERSNYEHPNESNGQIHDEDRKAASGDEGEEGGPSEEFASACLGRT